MNVRKIIALSLAFVVAIPFNIVSAESFNNIVDKKYNKVKKNKVENFNLVEYGYIPEEVKAKLNIMKEVQYLEKKTNYKYEIALAYSDGSFEYIEGVNDYDLAINMANKLTNKYKDDSNVVPSIINEDGNVIYSTNGVGRIRKYVEGALDTSNNISYIFPDSNTTNINKADTYINHRYVDDVALITQENGVAKIQVSGKEGWVSSYNEQGNYDLIVTPINQYTNPSYYSVKNGVLNHFISYDITAKEEIEYKTGNTLQLGPAPEYMEEGVEYLSFDGMYFYKGDTVSKAYGNLVSDLRNNNKSLAINKDKPYYNYYNNLPVRTKTSYTASELENFININTINKPDSKLRGIGKILKDAEEKYGVNALITLSIAINESGWGDSKLAKENNNLFGLNAQDSNLGLSNKYNSIEDCVVDFSKNWISKWYCDAKNFRAFGSNLGNKNIGINVKYASDPYWGEKAASHYYKADYFLSNNNLSNLMDFNSYALIKTIGANDIVDIGGNILYSIGEEKDTSTGTIKKGNIIALNKKFLVERLGEKFYAVNLDRIWDISITGITGDYNWGKIGYIKKNNVVNINTASKKSANYTLEDLNSDDKVDIIDLAILASEYNVRKNSNKFIGDYDLNDDGIIDLYDLIKISKKIR